jgi:hypothetical protein
MPWRFVVIDGADHGQSFLLPEAGTARVGNSRKHCEVHLHDLYVTRAHCDLEVEGPSIEAVALDSTRDTLVNGVKIKRQKLNPGDILRVGNSFLRLEAVDPSAVAAPAPAPARPAAAPKAEAPAKAPEKPVELPRLPPDRLAELTGHTLSHFRVGTVLGLGHFGVSFRAYDLLKGQDVALKVLSPVFPAGDQEMQHFARSLKLVLPLHHPSLVALRGAGRTGPYVWIAEELVEGESVAAVLRRLAGGKKPKWRPALRVAVHVGRALEAAHRQHLVHGNVTPANILLPAGGGPAKLNDLALLRALQGSKLLQQTLPQKRLAELPYLSPEHLAPGVAVDHLSDQYSLGAVLYALLTGQPPCEGASPEETIESIQRSMPPRPKEQLPTMPDALEAVVLRMLAKHPEERCPTTAAVVADAEQIAAEQEEEV